MSLPAALVDLGHLSSEARTRAEYDAARQAWLHRVVACDTIYEGAVRPDEPQAPVVTHVDPKRTAACEAHGYWPWRLRLTDAASRCGGVALDYEELSEKERDESPFHREAIRSLGIRATAVAVVSLRGRPISSIYFGRTLRGARFGDELELLREALPLLALGEAVHRGAAAVARSSGLTRREEEVLGHVVRGLTNAEIALLLGTSPITVKNQLASILAKTGAKNRTELAWRHRH